MRHTGTKKLGIEKTKGAKLTRIGKQISRKRETNQNEKARKRENELPGNAKRTRTRKLENEKTK
jgi:hypothetical protein